MRTTNSRANTNKNKKLKASGLHPPAFNNNLNDKNKKTDSIKYAIIAGFCGRLKHCAILRN